jgi:hypothetical protein
LRAVPLKCAELGSIWLSERADCSSSICEKAFGIAAWESKNLKSDVFGTFELTQL